jgi:hypothetical protein
MLHENVTGCKPLSAAIIKKPLTPCTLDTMCHAKGLGLCGKNGSTNLEIPSAVLAYFQTCRNQAFGISSMVRVHVVAVLQPVQDRGGIC